MVRITRLVATLVAVLLVGAGSHGNALSLPQSGQETSTPSTVRQVYSFTYKPGDYYVFMKVEGVPGYLAMRKDYVVMLAEEIRKTEGLGVPIWKLLQEDESPTGHED